jgi:hypothetical protein
LILELDGSDQGLEPAERFHIFWEDLVRPPDDLRSTYGFDGIDDYVEIESIPQPGGNIYVQSSDLASLKLGDVLLYRFGLTNSET